MNLSTILASGVATRTSTNLILNSSRSSSSNSESVDISNSDRNNMSKRARRLLKMPSLNSKKGLIGINDEMEIYNNTEPILRNIGRFFEQWNGFPSGKGIIKGSFFSRFSVLAVGESDLKVRVDMNDTCHYTEENDDCTIKPKYSYGFVISRDFKAILDAFEISSKDEFLPLNAYDYPFVADNVRQLCEAVCQYVDPVSLILMESSFCGASKIKGLCNLDYDKGYTVKITIPCSHFRGKECKCWEQQ